MYYYCGNCQRESSFPGFCSQSCQDAAAGSASAGSQPNMALMAGWPTGLREPLAESDAVQEYPGTDISWADVLEEPELTVAWTDPLTSADSNPGYWDEDLRRYMDGPSGSTPAIDSSAYSPASGAEGPRQAELGLHTDGSKRSSLPDRPKEATTGNGRQPSEPSDGDIHEPARSTTGALDTFLSIVSLLLQPASDADHTVRNDGGTRDTGDAASNSRTERIAAAEADLRALLASPPLKQICSICVVHETVRGGLCAGCAAQFGDSELPHTRSPLVHRVRLEGKKREFVVLESVTARSPLEYGAVSASARHEKGVLTSTLADLGEVAAYKMALRAGEIGLESPFIVNRGGPDFVTARYNPDVGYQVIINDAKTSTADSHPKPGESVPLTWYEDARQALLRADLADPQIERLLRVAWARGEIYLRQLDVAASPSGKMWVYGHPLIHLA